LQLVHPRVQLVVTSQGHVIVAATTGDDLQTVLLGVCARHLLDLVHGKQTQRRVRVFVAVP